MSKEEKKIEQPKYLGMNIHQRLHAVMKDVDYVQKTKAKGDGLKYSTVSHDSVTAAVRAPCVEWGVHYFPSEMIHSIDGNRTTVSVKIRFVNIDKPEDFVETPSFGYGIDPQDKGAGKAISYAVKYALLKSFGLETGDDPENDNIDHKPSDKKIEPQKISCSMALDRGQAEQIHAQALEKLNAAETLEALVAVWTPYSKKIKTLPEDLAADLIQKKDECKAELSKLNGVAH